MYRYPDRRRRPRIVTLKNFGYLTLAALVALTAVNIRSEMRGRRGQRDYGRLIQQQMPRELPQHVPPEVVQEADPVDDYSSADPMLLEPLAREQQWINTDVNQAQVSMTPGTQIVTPRAGDADVAIVGGPDGVAVVKQERRKPVLSGGFGRQ